jgi:Uma2 family endonuclease
MQHPSTAEAFLLPKAYLPMRVRPAERLTDDAILELSTRNKDLRIEQAADGDLIIMPPAGSDTGRRNANLVVAVGAWAQADGSGVCFDSSTGFRLPNGALLSPDLSWVAKARWDALSPRQQEGYAPLCPDFVIELRSPSDNLGEQLAKMREYMANGARLGWLIDPESSRVWVFEPGAAEPVCLENPVTVSADPVLPGFVLELARLG